MSNVIYHGPEHECWYIASQTGEGNCLKIVHSFITLQGYLFLGNNCHGLKIEHKEFVAAMNLTLDGPDDLRYNLEKVTYEWI